MSANPNGRQGALTVPIYEPAEVARLVGLTSSRVRRWLFGYQYRVGADKHERKQVPVIRRETYGKDRYASFLDLIELLSVKAFLAKGLSLQRLRRACNEAATLLDVDHPFARKRFFTGGGEIYLQIESTKGAPNLLQLLSHGQWVIEPVIREFAEQIDFDLESELASKWWPLGKGKHVVLDPHVSFGAPSIVSRGVKTSNVFDLYRAERRKAEVVARWMSLTVEEVEAAVRFEEQQLDRAA